MRVSLSRPNRERMLATKTQASALAMVDSKSLARRRRPAARRTRSTSKIVTPNIQVANRRNSTERASVVGSPSAARAEARVKKMADGSFRPACNGAGQQSPLLSKLLRGRTHRRHPEIQLYRKVDGGTIVE